MKLVVTGASGYIGEVLLSHARRAGFTVVAASRSRPVSAHDEWLAYDMSSAGAIELPADTGMVIHLAADTKTGSGLDQEIEVRAAQQLLQAAEKASAQLLFVSSQAARQDAPTPYGRTKWRIEELVLASGGCVVRPGQVYGGPERGLYGELLNTLRRSRVFPRFIPPPGVQPIHVADLADGLLRICSLKRLPAQVLCLGSVRAMPFSSFLAGIAVHNGLKRPRFIPVPAVLVRFIGWCLGQGLRDRLGISRLKSLFELPAMKTRDSLDLTGLELRPFPDEKTNQNIHGLLCSRQAAALLSYVLKEPPDPQLHQRYTDILEPMDRAARLHLPGPFLRFPALLSLLDAPWQRQSEAQAEFLKRLQIAVVLAEASPQGARRFLGAERAAGSWSGFLDIALAVSGEVMWRILRLFFAPLAEPRIRTVAKPGSAHREY